jgi:hypothetical protein
MERLTEEEKKARHVEAQRRYCARNRKAVRSGNLKAVQKYYARNREKIAKQKRRYYARKRHQRLEACLV